MMGLRSPPFLRFFPPALLPSPPMFPVPLVLPLAGVTRAEVAAMVDLTLVMAAFLTSSPFIVETREMWTTKRLVGGASDRLGRFAESLK